MRNVVRLRPKVFLCHSSRDKPFVRRVARDLVKEGVDVWLDEWEIHVGDSISGKIRDGLGSADYIVVAMSKSLLSSKGALRELDSSLVRATYDNGAALLPIRLDDSAMPPDMADLLYADFRNSYDLGMDKLKQAILDAAAITDTSIVVSLSGDTAHGLDAACLIAQLRSSARAYMQKNRDVVVRFQPGPLLKQLEAKVAERLSNLDAEPKEWKAPEHDLAGHLLGSLGAC